MNRTTWQFLAPLWLAFLFLVGCDDASNAGHLEPGGAGGAAVGGSGGFADGGSGGLAAGGSGGSGGIGNEGGTGGTCPEEWSVNVIEEGPRDIAAGEFEIDGVIDEIGSRVHESGSAAYRVLTLRSVPGAFVRLFYKDPDARILPPFSVGDRASVRLMYPPAGIVDPAVKFAFRFRNHDSGAEWELTGRSQALARTAQGPSFSFGTEDVHFSIGEHSICTPDGSDSLFPISAVSTRYPAEAIELRPFEPARLEAESGPVTVMVSGVFASRVSSDPDDLKGTAIAIVARPPRANRTPCDGAHPCPDGFFCDLAEDRCSGPGFCQPQPTGCFPEENFLGSQRVCACDGQVYHSVCAANRSGTDVAFSEMTCPSDYFLCGAMACRIGQPCFRSLEGQRSADFCLFNAGNDCDDGVVCGCLPDSPGCECSDDTPLPGAVTLLCSESESGG